MPTLDARGEGIELRRQRRGDAEADARQRIALALVPDRQHHGLTAALQLGHGQLVVHLVARQAIAGQLPAGFVAVLQAQPLEHRHVQLLEQPGDLLAARTRLHSRDLHIRVMAGRQPGQQSGDVVEEAVRRRDLAEQRSQALHLGTEQADAEQRPPPRPTRRAVPARRARRAASECAR
ncbi:hypothetical protein GCM10027514_24240 [Azotobacter armeniacus]